VRIFLAAILALTASAGALHWLRQPFLWCSGIWMAFLAFSFASVRRTTVKRFFTYCMAVVGAWGVAEAFLGLAAWARPAVRTEGPRVHQPDVILGWVLPPDSTWPSAKYFGDELIYRVTYSTDSRGLRVSPAGGKREACLLFFGGSLTFGAGVNNEQTMPFRVGEKSGHRVLNFGVSGYGPHQTLALVETGRVEQALEGCEPRYAIYQGVNDHVARAAGKRAWARQGPRYRLGADGTVERAGQFEETAAASTWIERQLEKSLVYQRHFGKDPRVTDADVQRYVAILDAVHKTLAAAFPDVAFHVIQWGTRYREPLEALRKGGAEVHFIDDILPGYNGNEVSYQLSPHDWHPNATTHERIAEYITAEILGQ